jgi:hypothetical protein
VAYHDTQPPLAAPSRVALTAGLALTNTSATCVLALMSAARADDPAEVLTNV